MRQRMPGRVGSSLRYWGRGHSNCCARQSDCSPSTEWQGHTERHTYKERRKKATPGEAVEGWIFFPAFQETAFQLANISAKLPSPGLHPEPPPF